MAGFRVHSHKTSSSIKAKNTLHTSVTPFHERAYTMEYVVTTSLNLAFSFEIFFSTMRRRRLKIDFKPISFTGFYNHLPVRA
jgi:hypothetical protein